MILAVSVIQKIQQVFHDDAWMNVQYQKTSMCEVKIAQCVRCRMAGIDLLRIFQDGKATNVVCSLYGVRKMKFIHDDGCVDVVSFKRRLIVGAEKSGTVIEIIS